MRSPACPGKLWPALWLCALLAAGCIKVGPDFVRPETAVEPTWLEAEDARVKTEPVEYRSWWQAFNDAVLDKLIDQAYQENLTLQIAGVRILEARAQLGIAIGELFPQTQQAYGSVQENRISRRAPQAVVSNFLDYRTSELGLTASWELDFWGKYRRAIESADATLKAAVADYDSALVSLTADVATAYITLRTVEKRLSIARANVETQKESLTLSDARFKGGTTSERDVEQARTVLLNTQAQIPTLETQRRQSTNAICVLLGRPPERLAEVLKGPTEIPAPPPQVIVGIPADLLRRRPDIKSAELKAAAQCAQIGIAKAQLLPAFSLTGTFSFLSSDVGTFSLGDMFQWRSRSALGGPSFRWDILNYGRLTNNVRLQDARFQELLINYQNSVLKAQQEVEDNLVAFLRSQERADLLAQSAAAAQRSLGLAVLQYREGITDFTTVLTAQQSLLSEQDSLATTLGDISRNLVGVYRALGGGWEIREGHEFVPEAVQAAMAKRTNWGKLLRPAAQKALAP
jgi:NodT family efflux transporter outer membrane factor (OMF) lipoprotein